MGILGAIGKGFKGAGKFIGKGTNVAAKGVTKLGKLGLMIGVNSTDLSTLLNAYSFVSNVIFKHHVNNELDLIQLQNDGLKNEQQLEFTETKAKIDGADVSPIQAAELAAESKINAEELDQASKSFKRTSESVRKLNETTSKQVEYKRNEEIDAIKLELSNLEAKKDEEINNLFIKQGFLSTLKSISSLSLMMDRSLKLQTKMEAMVESISNVTKVELAERLNESKAQLELKEKEAEIKKSADVRSESDRKRILTELNNIKIKLKDKKDEIDKKLKSKTDNPVDAIVEFAGNTALVAAMAKALIPTFLESFHSKDDEVEETPKDEDNDETAKFSIIDSLHQMFNGVDPLRTTGSYLRNFSDFSKNLFNSAVNNVTDMAELGGEFLGPAGYALGGMLGVLTAPFDTMLSLGIGTMKATRDLIQDAANIPVLGAPLKVIGDALGMNTSINYESDIHTNRFNDMLAQNFIDQSNDSKLSYTLEELEGELEQITDENVRRTAESQIRAFLIGEDTRHANRASKMIDENFIDQYNGNKLTHNIQSIFNEAKYIKNSRQRSLIRRKLGALLKDEKNGSYWERQLNKYWSDDIELLDEEGQREFYKNYKPKDFKFDKKSPYYLNEHGVKVRSGEVNLNGLRMGPLQSRWIKDAYESIGYGRDSVITSAVRTPEEQAKVNATGSSHHHESGIALDLRTPGDTEIEKFENGLEIMRYLRDRMETEGVDPNDYQFLVHKVKRRADGIEGALHAHLVYNPEVLDESQCTGDLNIGSRSRNQNSEFNARQREWKGVGDSKGKVIGVFSGDNGKAVIDATNDYKVINREEGDPSTEKSINSPALSESSELLIKSSALLIKKLDNVELNILTAIQAIEPKSLDVSEYVTAPRRGI